MDRELLFRGKRVDNGEWVEGCFIKPNAIYIENDPSGNLGKSSDGKFAIGLDVCLVYPETVGQFTGLLDRNRNKIFEGDIIVKGCYPYFDNGVKNYVSTVEWIYSSWQEVLHCINPLKNGISDGVNDIIEEDDDDGSTSFEIIGNIHDNQEIHGKEVGNG